MRRMVVALSLVVDLLLEMHTFSPYHLDVDVAVVTENLFQDENKNNYLDFQRAVELWL